ncbi:MAG: hypothetical protein V4736_03915 [Bdellovibrionota bacterium]
MKTKNAKSQSIEAMLFTLKTIKGSISAFFKLLVLTSILLSAPITSARETTSLPSESTQALWSEFIPYSDLEAHLPKLKEKNLSLFVAVKADDPKFDEFAQLYQKAAREGVQIRPWLLLPVSQGYWFNKWNYLQARDFVNMFVDEMTARGVSIQWVTFDMESPKELMEATETFLKQNRAKEMLSLLKVKSRDGSIVEAVANYTSLVQSLQQRGIKVHGVTTHFILNDLSDNHRRIQSALGIPISGVPWDEISFMVYRADFRRIYKNISSQVVYKYAKRARKYFGERAGMDIGEAGKVFFPKPFTGYTEQEDLKQDLEAVKAAGINNVHIYSLDGMLDEGVDFWIKPYGSEKPKKFDLTTLFVFRSVDYLKLLLPRGH